MKLVALACSAGLVAALNCRPEGPVLPKPAHLGDAATFRRAAVDLAHTFDALSSGQIAVHWPVQNVSFSVAVVSADQDNGSAPLWQYHHRAAANVDGTETVDAHSQYLIGSVSKMITDYILLVAGMDLDVPVRTYVPRLSDSSEWDGITLRMLASQMAGVPTNYGFSEYYFLKDVYLALGFPPINESDYPPCGVTSLNDACTAQQLELGLGNSYPVVPPGSRPAYSNAAFALIGLAVQAHTGLNYTQQVHDLVSSPLGLTSTHPSSPSSNASNAVIPPGDSGWGADYGLNAPQGGLVSSVADLCRLAHAILARTAPGLSPAQTRQWLKPSSYAGNMASAVGMPWEIRRHANLTPEHAHPVTVYGKSGAAPLYRSQFALVDEYGLGIVVLTAGDMDAATYIYDAALAVLVNAADSVTREHAKAGYAREFASTSCKTTGNNTVKARLTLDEDSLVLSALSRGSADILAGWLQVFNKSLGTFGPKISDTVRLFPTELSENVTLSDGGVGVKEVWRLWPDLAAPAVVDLPGSELDRDDCLGWTLGDWIHYGGEPLDRVIFYRRGTKVNGFEVPFLRSGVMKISV